MQTLSSTRREMETFLQVRIEHRSELEATLESGIAHLQKQGTLRSLAHGILITRTSSTDFTLEIHPDVPFGTTREKQDW